MPAPPQPPAAMTDADARAHLARVRRGVAATPGARAADFSTSELWACVRAVWADRRSEPAMRNMSFRGRFDAGRAADVVRAALARAGRPAGGAASELTAAQLAAFLELAEPGAARGK